MSDTVRINADAPTVDDLIAYETGQLDADETIALFQALVTSGLAWQLQGSYGREAARLVAAGLVTLPGPGE